MFRRHTSIFLWEQVPYQVAVKISQVSKCLLWYSGSPNLGNRIPKKLHDTTRVKSKAFFLGSKNHTLKIKYRTFL